MYHFIRVLVSLPISYNNRFLIQQGANSYNVAPSISIKKRNITPPSVTENNNINDAITRYSALRNQINVIVDNADIVLNSPNSSVKKCITQIYRHPILRKQYGKVQKILSYLNNNINEIQNNSDIDHDAYFKNIDKLTENLQILNLKFLSFSDKSDAVDEFNPLDASATLSRIIAELNDMKEKSNQLIIEVLNE